MLFYERLILEEGTMEKLKFKQIMSLTLTLFAIFSGQAIWFFRPLWDSWQEKIIGRL